VWHLFVVVSDPSHFKVDAIRELEVVKNRDIRGSRQLLFFAYALTMKGVTNELDILGKTLQDAFGVIGQVSLSKCSSKAMVTKCPSSERGRV
jgi:hypothetical protein